MSEVPNAKREIDRRRFLQYGGTAAAVAAVATRPGSAAAATPNDLAVDGISWSEPTALYLLTSTVGPTPILVVDVRNGSSQPTSGKIAWSLTLRGKQIVKQGSTTFEIAAAADLRVSVPTVRVDQPDYYVAAVTVTSASGSTVAQDTLSVGVVHAPVEGLRPDSPFGINLRESDTVPIPEVARRMGVKWLRTESVISPTTINPQPGVFWGQTQIGAARAYAQKYRDLGISTIALVSYTQVWNVIPRADGTLPPPSQSRPKDLNAQAEAVYRGIAAVHDLVDNIEIWNEPWVMSGFWPNGTGADYLQMARLIWDRVKPDFPDVNLIGGGSVEYNRDILYALGAHNRGYVDGSVLHYEGGGELAAAKTQVVLDRKWSKSGGRAGQWETEVAEFVGSYTYLPEAEREWTAARGVATTYLRFWLGKGDKPMHIFWFVLQTAAADDFGIYNLNGTPKPQAIAYAAMTHFLEDTTLVGDVYPAAKSTWGVLFERKDGGATAVIYPQMSGAFYYPDGGHRGTLTLSGAKGITVYDYLGAQLADDSIDDTLRLALRPEEVTYLVSDLSSAELRDLLTKRAVFDYEQPFTVTPLSFTEPVGDQATIEVQVENLSPNPLSGRLTLSGPPTWSLARPDAQIPQLAPGEKRLLQFPANRTTADANNQYPISWRLEVHRDNRTVATQQGVQTLQVAYAPYAHITVDGDLSDWADIIPVTLSTSSTPTTTPPSTPVTYTAWTAWDDDSFYFAAKVPDQKLDTDPPYAANPFQIPSADTDHIQLAFDLIKDNAPDDLLLGDPLYEKACASDVDHLFCASRASDGTTVLRREIAPGTNYQESYYPIVDRGVTPPLGPMQVTATGGNEGTLVIRRDETNKETIYELAMAWPTLAPLHDRLATLGSDKTIQTTFAFEVGDQSAGTRAYWTAEAGQLDNGAHGFAPFWNSASRASGGRILTRWGFGGRP